MSEDRSDQKKLLVDLTHKEVRDELFFILPEYVDFWVDNEDFRNEYHRLYSEGEDDGFYLFLKTAQQVMYNAKYDEALGLDLDFDFRTARRSIRMMETCLSQGFDNRVLNPKLNSLIGRIYAPKNSLKYWFTVPEFSNEIERLTSIGARISDRTAYEIMKKVFDEKVRAKMRGVSEGNKFSFKHAKAAIRSLEKRLNIPVNQRVRADIPRPMQVSTSDEDSDSK